MMNAMRICSVCSRPLAANAPQGLCPECLLKAGLGTGVDIGPDSQSQAESGKVPFVAPTPDELARPFPQLEILGFIGQGGMGAVYRARQKALDRVVALKILPPGIGKDPAFAERFTREAKALARLNHPGIVTLYEFGRADGLFFFLMEFVDGVNLRQLLEAGRLSPREALAIVPQICDALQYAHDQGIVHRDIKPENILLDRQGRVKVADFGLAKLVGTEGEPSAAGGAVAGSVVLTEAGKVMGTPQYMAPEQRVHPAEVDHRVDIYSLGVVLYQMLTGELPGKRIEPPSHKVQVDVRIDEIVLRALEKTPELRYQTAADFRTQIETVVNDTGTAGPANRPDHSAPRLLNVGTSLVTMPEQLGTFDGQFFLYRRKSQMLLEGRQLTFARGGTTTVIPLAAIRDLSIGHYPRTMNPAGLDFISVTYDEGGRAKRLFFSPYERWFGLPSHFNQFVAEWFAAIRAAVVAATGREPGNTPAEQLGVPPGSMAIYALLLGPAVLAGTFVLAGVVMGVHGFKGDAATHSFPSGAWLIILGILGVGFLSLALRRLFGGSRKHAPPSSPSVGSHGSSVGPSAAQADRKWPLPLVGVRNGQRVIHWPGLVLLTVLIVAMAAAVSLTFYLLLPVKGSLGLVAGLLVGFILLAVKLRQAWTTPIERLPRLDAPLYGAVRTWKVAAIVVGALLLILALDGVIGWVLWTGTKLYVDFFVSIENLANPHYNNWRKPLDGLLVEHRVGIVSVLTLAIGGLLNFLVVRCIWRAVNKSLGKSQPASNTATTPGTGSPPRSGRAWKIAAVIVAGLLLLFAIPLASLGVLWVWLGSGTSENVVGRLVGSAPFVARFPQGTVELVALTVHPSVTNQPWWRPDGSISSESFGGPVTRESWSSGKEMREIGFRIRGGTNIGSSPVLEFDAMSGVNGQGPLIYPETPDAPYTTIVEPFACPSGMKKTNIRVRDATGLWKVEFRNVSLELGYKTQVRVVDAAEDWGSTSAATFASGPSIRNAISGVHCNSGKATIAYEIDDAHELFLFAGAGSRGWSVWYAGTTSEIATVEASDQIKMEDGSLGRGFIFQVKGTRHYIAITPDGPVPFGELVFREDANVAGKEGTFTFADIRQANGTLIPVSIGVRPVSGRSSGSQGSGAVAEPPTLRFLAWQDKNPSWRDWKAWQPNGELVDTKDEQGLLLHHPPTRIDLSATKEGRGARVLFVWFSHPNIERRSYAEMTMADSTGRTISPCLDGYGGGVYPAKPSEAELGWLVRWFAPAQDAALPLTVNLTLRYSLGDWQFPVIVTREMFGGTMDTEWGNIPGAGETLDGKAFVSLVRNTGKGRGLQVDFAAETTDGRWIEPSGTLESGPPEMSHERFEFDAPLGQIKEFRLRTCPIRTVEYRNVLLQAGHSTEVQASPVSTSQPPAFGPVIERVIATTDGDDQGLVFFDLETGTSFKPPFPLKLHPNQGPAFVELTPELKQWIRARDVDVLLHLGEKNWDMMTLDMQEGFAGQLNEWETISPEKVIALFAQKDAERLVRDEVPASSFGNRYRDGFSSFNAFRTRSNAMGVYQFEGVDNSTRRGVGIRYKLVQATGSTSAASPQTNTSQTFSLRYLLASEMADDLRQILLGRFGMEARPGPDNMELTVTAPPDVLNRVSTFVTVTDWPNRIAPGPDSYYPRENVELASRSFFYACSIEDTEGVALMLSPGLLAELSGTSLAAHGVLGEEKDAELVRQLRGNWSGKQAAVREVIKAWNRFPLRRLRAEPGVAIGFGLRYFATAVFEGAPEERTQLSFIPDRTGGTNGPLLIDTLPPWLPAFLGGESTGAKQSSDTAPPTPSPANGDMYSAVTVHPLFCQGKPRDGLEGWEQGWKIEDACLVNTADGASISTTMQSGKEDLVVSASLSLDEIRETGMTFTLGSGYTLEFGRADQRFIVSGPTLLRSYQHASPADLITPGRPFLFRAERRGSLIDFFIDDKLIHSVQYDGAMGTVGFASKKGVIRIRSFGVSQMWPFPTH